MGTDVLRIVCTIWPEYTFHTLIYNEFVAGYKDVFSLTGCHGFDKKRSVAMEEWRFVPLLIQANVMMLW